MDTSVAIVGGGLAGLVAARRLHAAGIDFLLIEARDRLGGRILSVDETGRPALDGFDLGPSWFWPQMQPAMASLVEELGLETFPQYSDGDIVFERMSKEPPRRYRAYAQEPQSRRFAGGTGALITALQATLPQERLLMGKRVTAAALNEVGVKLSGESLDGQAFSVQAERLIFAFPPRLLETSVSLSPTVDADITARWRASATWMAPHAKFVAIYERAFWRDAGLSGGGQSHIGPLSELHDATTASGMPALFGFVGIGADQRKAVGEAALTAACLQQLGRLFGSAALSPRSTAYKDWTADPLTATTDDRTPSDHPQADGKPWIVGPWQQRVHLAGSETSLADPGYLAGAVDAANRTASNIIDKLRLPSESSATC